MAFCSAVTLCFASIFSLAAAALLAIAFSTDNWQTISVNKNLNAAVTAPKDIAAIMVGSRFSAKHLIDKFVTLEQKYFDYRKNMVLVYFGLMS